MSLTPNQVAIIKATVPILAAHGATITRVFYENLLIAAPDLRSTFNHSNQKSQHQPKALANALYAYAANITDLGVLSPALTTICNKHASLGIQPVQYEAVGKYLLEAMGQVLGAALTPEILEAWGVAYWQLANIMIEKEKGLYERAEAAEWAGWRDFRIEKKVKESEDICSFYLVPVDGKPLPAWKPGQYISIETEIEELGFAQSRQYSLSEAPRSDYLRISVKREPGEEHPAWVSNVLHGKREEGDVVRVTHPFGEFIVDADSGSEAPVVLLGAGVGLTPLLSILNTLVEKGSSRKISWIHTARTPAARAFGTHVKGLAKTRENVQATMVEGHLDLEKLDRESELFVDDERTQYFICGPVGFMDGMEEKLKGFGVDGERIKSERFGVAA